MPTAGELVKATDLVLALGGCASNAAVDLAKLDVPSAICGKAGDDVFGRFVAETLRSHNVDTRALQVDPTRATSQTLIINVQGQDRRFIHSFGANEGLTAADIDAALAACESAKALYVGGYLILPSLDPEALAERFARCRAQGIHTVLDVATPGPADYLVKLKPVLPYTDVFLPNSDEAALILGERDPVRQALAFHDLGAARVVITRGEGGSVAVSDQMRVKLGVFNVPFVDGSGGGDAFDAGYIAGLLDGRDEMGCLALASALGASCVRAVGTTGSVFHRAEAEEFLRLRSRELTVESF